MFPIKYKPVNWVNGLNTTFFQASINGWIRGAVGNQVDIYNLDLDTRRGDGKLVELNFFLDFYYRSSHRSYSIKTCF